MIVAVAPAAATVATGGTAQFTATVQNASAASVQWEVNSVPGGATATGTINSSGMYRAPSDVPGTTVKITAVLQTDTTRFGSADVTVVPPVSLSPRQAALTTSETVQFQVAGPTTNSGVTWSASGGSITTSGLYTPPAASGIFTVTATSRFDPTLSSSAAIYVTDFAGNLSWRNDSGLTGQNRQELALSPAMLAAGAFGKISSCAVDGQIYAQPLYVANLTIGGQVHNVVYVATEHDSVYAFDADAVPCQVIWKTSFLSDVLGITPVPAADIPGSDITPWIGITGTPVIDRASGTLYLVARTEESGLFGQGYFQRLHALDIVSGSEKFDGPVALLASAPCGPRISTAACGDGSDGTDHIPFDRPFDQPLENQRAGLQLINGKVYIAFTGHDPTSGFHGWLLVYHAATLTQADFFNTTPNASRGGLIAAPSTDSAGNIYVATGHGTFDSNLPLLSRRDFGQTVLKLSPPPLTIADASKDTFTPFNQSILNLNQNDLGATGVLILPDLGAPNPPLAVVGGTSGVLYILNRDNLGGFTSAAPGVVKTLNLTGGIYGTPAYWQSTQNTLYIAAAGDALKAFSLSGGTLAGAPSSQSSATFGLQGASPVVSSNGIDSGVVWVLDTAGGPATPAAVLHAYDAANLARELYSSAVKAADTAGPCGPHRAPPPGP